jgi:hypothetical protein
MLMVPNLRVVEPNNIFRKVPTRRPNAEMRTREYLTPDEVEKLIRGDELRVLRELQRNTSHPDIAGVNCRTASVIMDPNTNNSSTARTFALRCR